MRLARGLARRPESERAVLGCALVERVRRAPLRLVYAVVEPLVPLACEGSEASRLLLLALLSLRRGPHRGAAERVAASLLAQENPWPRG